MRGEVRIAMEEGAMGLGSSLIYAPAFYAKTDELVALAKVVGEYGGVYISHMRSEGNRLLESVDELITIAREAGVAAEIYHLKASGKSNWSKMDAVYAKIESARKDGLKITADMYTYPAGSTGLDASMPPWVQEGGYEAWVNRLRDPDIRARVLEEMRQDTDDWENLFHAAGPDGILLAYFQNPELKRYSGKTLAEVAALRETTAADAAIDLVIEDGTRVQTIYFLMSEDNIRKQLDYSWLSFGSDASAVDPDIVSGLGSVHPRTYGNFVRVIGKYVRDEKVLSMADAIRKLTSLPITNLGISQRGFLKPGYYADVVVFDPETVADLATFEDPHQLATGVNHVLINGSHVLRNGEHTGATPGRFIRGPGYRARH
jgi:N-acyl-D-amino-acid deacylase